MPRSTRELTASPPRPCGSALRLRCPAFNHHPTLHDQLGHSMPSIVTWAAVEAGPGCLWLCHLVLPAVHAQPGPAGAPGLWRAAHLPAAARRPRWRQLPGAAGQPKRDQYDLQREHCATSSQIQPSSSSSAPALVPLLSTTPCMASRPACPAHYMDPFRPCLLPGMRRPERKVDVMGRGALSPFT